MTVQTRVISACASVDELATYLAAQAATGDEVLRVAGMCADAKRLIIDMCPADLAPRVFMGEGALAALPDQDDDEDEDEIEVWEDGEDDDEREPREVPIPQPEPAGA